MPEHQLTEIAAVVMDSNTFEILDTFSSLINPGRPIPWQAQQINGINDNTVKGASGARAVLAQFMEWVKKQNASIVAGHNIKSFDLKFIERDCTRLRVDNAFASMQILDTLDYVRGLGKTNIIPNYNQATATGRVSYSMSALIKHFGLEEQTHRALNDVMQNIIVYRLLKGLEGTKDYGF